MSNDTQKEKLEVQTAEPDTISVAASSSEGSPTDASGEKGKGVETENEKPSEKIPSYQNIRVKGGIVQTSIDLPFLRKKHVSFSVGDTIRVDFRIREGEKERIQVYEGIVIAIRGEGSGRNFIVRRISHDVGVERIFPYYSPSIQEIRVVRKGRIRRARLYYLREKSGKAGRIKEAFKPIPTITDKAEAKKTSKAHTVSTLVSDKEKEDISSQTSISASGKSDTASKKDLKTSKTVKKKTAQKMKKKKEKESRVAPVKKIAKKVSKKAIAKKTTKKKASAKKIGKKIGKKVGKKKTKKSKKK